MGKVLLEGTDCLLTQCSMNPCTMCTHRILHSQNTIASSDMCSCSDNMLPFVRAYLQSFSGHLLITYLGKLQYKLNNISKKYYMVYFASPLLHLCQLYQPLILHFLRLKASDWQLMQHSPQYIN